MPAMLGEPQSVGALTTTEIERAAGRHWLDQFGQSDVHPSTPHPLPFAVALFPGLLCLRHCHANTLPAASSWRQAFLHAGKRQLVLDHLPRLLPLSSSAPTSWWCG